MRRLIISLFAVMLLNGVVSGQESNETDFSLHALFSNNMVLQRDREIKVWGTANSGQSIKIRIGKNNKSTAIAEDGIWKALLQPMDAGGPYELAIEAAQTIVFTNVMVGDVWICSGQSNMQWPVKLSKNAEQEIETANHPQIRLFRVPNTTADNPQTTLKGKWMICSSQTIPSFSAVGYFFGRDLQEHFDVPIGLINSSWGGTRAEAWTPNSTLESKEEFIPVLTEFGKAVEQYPAAIKKYKKDLAFWNRSTKTGTVGPSRQIDTGNTGFESGWADPATDVSDWSSVEVPCLIESITNIDGAVWFRKEVTLPESLIEKPLMLSLGPLDDFDQTYVNGTQVGFTDSATKSHWLHPRQYEIPKQLIRTDKVVIATRIFDHFKNGGFLGMPQAMKITASDTDSFVPIAGEWSYKIELALDPRNLSAGKPRPPMGSNSCNAPSRLYNAMIHPLTSFGIKGAIWYQGENNAHNAEQYRALLPAMIESWRESWGCNFPFLIVQLANFMPVVDVPSDSPWAELREAQAMTAYNDSSAGLAVTIDVGEADDIHPTNKQTVGKRLALAALGIAYNEKLVYSGPVYDSMEIRENEIVLKFKHTGSGLVAVGGELSQFAVAGGNRKFVWANARIENDTVVVQSDEVMAPIAVRYAWGNNPDGCNLYNKEGLPAVPFQTDK